MAHIKQNAKLGSDLLTCPCGQTHFASKISREIFTLKKNGRVAIPWCSRCNSGNTRNAGFKDRVALHEYDGYRDAMILCLFQENINDPGSVIDIVKSRSPNGLNERDRDLIKEILAGFIDSINGGSSADY